MIATHTNQYATRRNGTPDQSSSARSPSNLSDDVPKILHAMTKAEAMTMPAKAVQHPSFDSTSPKSSTKNKKWRKKTNDKQTSVADGAESFDDAAAPFEKSNGVRREDPQVSIDACWDNVKNKPMMDFNFFESTFQRSEDPFSSPQQSYEFSISADSNGNRNGYAHNASGKCNNKKKDRSSPKHEDEGPNRFHDVHPSNAHSPATIPHNDASLKLVTSTKKNNATLPAPIFTIQTATSGNPSSIEFKKHSPRKSKKKSGRRSNNNKNGKNNSINNEDDELWKIADTYVDYSTNAQGAAILASLGQYGRNYDYGYYDMPYRQHSTAPDHDSYARADSPIEPYYETTNIAPPHVYYTQGSAAAAAASTYAMYFPPALDAYYGTMSYPSYEEMCPSYYYTVPSDDVYYCPPHYEGRGEEAMAPCVGAEKIKLNADAPSFVPKTILQ